MFYIADNTLIVRAFIEFVHAFNMSSRRQLEKSDKISDVAHGRTLEMILQVSS